jgi:hypothetical protein
MKYICPNGSILKTVPKILKFRQFDFYDTNPYIEMCYDLAHESLEKMFPQYLLFASDHFGISVIDNNNDECVEVTSFSTGRLGKIGPLAMRNENTKEVYPLCQNNNTRFN